VRQILVARLALMATIIALTLASLAYLAEERMLEEAVVAEAQDDLAELVERTREIISHDGFSAPDAFRQAVGEKIASSVRKNRRGKVVYARFFKPDISGGEEYLDRTFVLHEAVLAHVHAGESPEPETGTWSETVYIADILCVHAILPIDELGRSDTGYAEIVFVPSPPVLAAMERENTLHRRSRRVCRTGHGGAPLSSHPAPDQPPRRLLPHLQAANFETLALLGCAVAKRDSNTDEHNYRVTLYALRIAEAIGLTRLDARPRQGRIPARCRQDRHHGQHPAQARQAHGKRIRDHEDPRQTRPRRGRPLDLAARREGRGRVPP
jgi:HD-GYP domain-containing protein (c-di-GMP phosphodiesterase class II)